MKNLRGSVLTVIMAIVVGGVGKKAAAQPFPPTRPADSAPLGAPPQNAIVPPTDPRSAPFVPQLPTANGQIPTLGIQAAPAQPQTPLPVAQLPAPQYAQPAYGVSAAPAAYPAATPAPMGMQPSMGMRPPMGMLPPMGMGYPGVQPASYGVPQAFPGANPMPMQMAYKGGAGGFGGGSGGCASCSGQGCSSCGGGRFGGGLGNGGLGGGIGGSGAVAGFLSGLLPYGEGGPCAPRWYDISLDAMYLTRERASRRIDFSSDVIGAPPAPQDVLLSTDDLDFNEELGFRLTGVRQLWSGSNIEFTYFGLFNWATSAVNRPSTFVDDIFSVMSNFGTNPVGGFDETDRARQHSLGYSSTLDNFELNIRKRFTKPNCRVQTSWLAGVRYIYLLEDFQYFTLGGDIDMDPTNGFQSRGSMDYNTRTRNSLTGFQVGGDCWANVVPGVNIGGDIKAGVYGNYSNQTTNIVATTTMPASTSTFTESVDGNDIALIGEANLSLIYRINPHWTLRAGYTLLYLDGVALAPENFNATPPNILTTGPGFTFAPRASTINDNGNAFYHGAYGGLEWMW